MTPVSAFRAFVDSRRQAWSAMLAEIVRIPSPYEAEHALVDHLAARITDLGLTVQRVSMDAAAMRLRPAAQPPISEVPGRDCLLVVAPGSGGGRSLALCAHMDTVETGDASSWTKPPLGAVVDGDNRLYGRGAMDDKAGLVLCLAVMEAISAGLLRPKGDVIFHLSLDEEVTGNGTLALLDHSPRPDAAIIIDGTRPDRAIDSLAGSLGFTIFLRGRPASVSVAHVGLNAAESLARLTADMKRAVMALNDGRQAPWTIFPSPFNFSVTAFHADGGVFTVPEQAHARCFVTFPPPLDLTAMKALLMDLAQAHQVREDLPQAVELVWDGLAVDPVATPDAHLAEALQRAALAAGFSPVAVGPSTGAADLRHFAALGVPGLLYGPGRGYNPHRADEHYYLDDLAPMAHLFLTLVADWCDAS